MKNLDPLSYEQFESKIYQYIGDSKNWANKVQDDFLKKEMLPIPLDLEPFVSGFDPRHKNFRDSIKLAWERACVVQEMMGRLAVGSCIYNQEPAVGIYISQNQFIEANAIMNDIPENTA